MSRGGEHLEGHLAEREPLAVLEQLDREGHVGAVAVGDDGADAVGELEVAADEVGVEVRLDDALDDEPFRLRLLEVDVDVAPWVDDHGATGRLVADEVRGVGQAPEVVLREDHLRGAVAAPQPGWGTMRM